MIVNLAWRDAMAAVGPCSAEDFDAGFAIAIAHAVVAAIQRPYERPAVPTVANRMFGSPGYQHMMAMHWQLEADCVAGMLKHTVRETKFSGRSYMIEAADFAAWLASQGETPSKHVAVWFDVHGVTWPPGLAAAPDVIAPVSPFPLADFDALAAYRKAQKAANVAAGKSHKTIPWTDGNQLDLLRGEYARLGGHPGAAVSIAKDLGTTRQAVLAALEKERKRKAPSPLPSLGTSRAA